MTRARRGALLLLLALSLGAAEPPPPDLPEPKTPAQRLSDIFGPETLEALQARGYVVLHGRRPDYRLQHIHKKALEDLAGHSQAALSLAESYRNFAEDRPIAPPGPPPFAGFFELPPSGLMTPSLHTVATALAAIHEQESQLALSSRAVSQTPLFETRWGAPFAARNHAGAIEDPSGLVKPYFDEFLGGVKPLPEAVRHFTESVSGRRRTDLSALLAADAKSGLPSEELRACLRQYLIEERRLFSVRRARAALKGLESRTHFPRELAELERVARALKDRPSLIRELEALIPKPSTAAAGIRLSSIGLRLPDPAKRFEAGDTLAFNVAYGLDGLPERKTAEIAETSFLEYPTEIVELRSNAVRRANGWPYVFERRLQLKDSRPIAAASAVSSPESNAVAESLVIEVGAGFEEALLKLGEADLLALACHFKDAEASYQRLEEGVSPSAKDKPQYRDLLRALRRRRRQASSNAAALAKLEELISASRADSSPELCRYEAERTRKAIRLLRDLPAGCDKHLPELDLQRAAIERRASDQETFSRLSAQSRKLVESCELAGAAEAASRALAVLEADPGARCGAAEAEARRLERELPRMKEDVFWREAFESRIKAAQSEPSPEGRLGVLNPMIARASWLPLASCYLRERAEAQALAETAGEALRVPEAELAGMLPADPELAKTESEVALERRRLEEAAAALEAKRTEEQNPISLLADPPAAPGVKALPKDARDGLPNTAAPDKPAAKPRSTPKKSRWAPKKEGKTR